MNRRIVLENRSLHATRERDGKLDRTLGGGAVLNILQWVRPGQARFTVEGEGAEIWTCEESAVQSATEKGFFSLRPTKARGRGQNSSRKLMKPCSELNRSVRPALEWVLLVGGAWTEGVGIRLVSGF
ncbi:MAG: hypothetical protein HYX43_00080 [Burkholderiales bacterium]|nr:hypothetical protein [Burkholderiales bacterium]